MSDQLPPPPPPVPSGVHRDSGRRGKSNLPAWMSSQQQQQQQQPPLPPPPSTTTHEYSEEEVAAVNSSIRTACQILEEARCLESECEANVLLATSLLQQHDALTVGGKSNSIYRKTNSKNNAKTDTTPTVDVSDLPGGVQDAWVILSEASNVVGGGNAVVEGTDGDAVAGSTTLSNSSTSISSFKINYETRDALPLGQGQVGKITATCTLSGCLSRISNIQNTIDKKGSDKRYGDAGINKTKRARDGTILKAALEASKAVPSSSLSSISAVGASAAQSTADAAQRANIWLKCLDERLREIKSYNARHGSSVLATTAASTLPQVGTDSTITNMTGAVTGTALKKRRRMGNPTSDGYDLASSAVESLQGLLGEEDMNGPADNQSSSLLPKSQLKSMTADPVSFSPEEVMGKYLDLQHLFDNYVTPIRDSIFTDTGSPQNGTAKKTDNGSSFSFSHFLDLLSKGEAGLVEGISESNKLQRDRKKYVRFLVALHSYLEGFLSRTQPLLDQQKEIIGPSIEVFLNEWKEKGGYLPGWEAKQAEAVLALAEQSKMAGQEPTTSTNGSESDGNKLGIDLSSFKTASDLEKAVDGDVLKAELSRLGLKCGGTVADRAKRLFLTKDTPLDKLPAKVLAKKPKMQAGNRATDSSADATASSPTASSATLSFKNERRIDIARREVVIMALLNQVKPTLEATIRRIQRRETQTARERAKELHEDLYGSSIEGPKNDGLSNNNNDYDDDDSDGEEEVIYNPKGVPLDWDGKPMPYWLFKLHGLNHFYPCEICGGERYRGRRAFELHFAESKHTMGMKTLDIPNTKHFHGVTTIEDAQDLWTKLQAQLSQTQFDGSKDEEYEDSHGRVLSRQAYEDLARQGLL